MPLVCHAPHFHPACTGIVSSSIIDASTTITALIPISHKRYSYEYVPSTVQQCEHLYQVLSCCHTSTAAVFTSWCISTRGSGDSMLLLVSRLYPVILQEYLLDAWHISYCKVSNCCDHSYFRIVCPSTAGVVVAVKGKGRRDT